MNDIATMSLFEDCKTLAKRLNLEIVFSHQGLSTVIFVGNDREYPFVDVRSLWDYLQGYAKAKGVK